MNLDTAPRRRALALALGLALLAALLQLALSPRAMAATDGLVVRPVSAATAAGVSAGDPITTFHYIVNADNTGRTVTRSATAGGSPCNPMTAGYPDACDWTSIAGVPGSSPIATQGDQSDFTGAATVPLAPGRYLVSVLADGFKLDGEHFTVNAGGTLDGPVTVRMQPTPLPDATVRALVFEDSAAVNGQPDEPAETPDPNPGPGDFDPTKFEGQLTDYLGQIITDTYGNPLCTTYVGEDPDTHEIPASALDADGVPVVDTPGGHCFAGPDGILTIPHMGTNRYALSVIAPNGENWVQTTTLEGNHDFDSWVMEGNTGYDTEFSVAGEPVPTAIFGFVKPKALPDAAGTPPTGEIKGVVDAMFIYVPATGGLTNNGTIFGGLNGGKIDKPIDRPWIALSDLNNGDQQIYTGRGNADGSFDITNVPDGDYSITWWDDSQNYILDLQNVSVRNGQVEDLGILGLQEWWTQISGHVFNDLNSNGKRDPGEPGIKDFPIGIKKRENSGMDRGNLGTTTAADGSYYMENVYPMTQWLVEEAYSDRYYTTGITYQADNQPDETTVLGAGVDVSFLPIIGLSGRLDWGVKPYAPNTNGGIVGTVSYDTTRNELDPRYAAVEPWQPGIPDLPVDLYAPVDCPNTADTAPADLVPCDTTPAGDLYQLNPDGSYKEGKLLNQYTTENWQRPGLNGDGECVPRDVNGDRIAFTTGQLVTNSDTDCLEGPLMGMQFQKGFSTVDGNYGFGDGCFTGAGYDPEAGACADGSDPTALPVGDYLVRVEIPKDPRGRPLYKVTREEDINIGNGDATIPQIPPPSCVGPLHTVDVAGGGAGADNYPAVNDPNGLTGVTVPASDPTDNPTFTDIGGSPYEGQQKPLCDTKLVHVSDQRSIAPTFNMFTDVPIPGRFWGLLVDDLNFSTDKHSLLYGEKAGIAFAPVGIYDYTDRLITTVESDFNGLFDVLLPSTNRINCPTPSGVCSNVYRFVGNDPGVPGALNANYKPDFRTIAAEFEAFPGLLVPADLAPTQVGVTVQLPGGQTNRVMCTLDAATPQLFRVSKPYVDTRVAGDNTFTISGQGFGAAGGRVTLDDSVALTTTGWSDTQIAVTVPAGTAAGPHQLNVVSANGQKTIDGITFHVLGAGYGPKVYEVGPGKAYAPENTLPISADHAIQSAINDAEAGPEDDLIVVYPGLSTATTNPRVNPRGAYYENLIISEPLKLQGVGPGGVQTATGATVPGSIIDGGAFGGDGPVATDWYTTLGALTWDGNQNVNDGAVISLYAQSNAFPATASFAPAIDGFDLRGGDQAGFPNNINAIGGGPTGLPAAVTTQGGAIFANAYVNNLQITNNVVQNNGGGYGTIRIGTPDLPDPDNHNDNVRIAKNRIIQNGGTNLAGGIGLFAGSDNYTVEGNDICGNFSAEYGGGLTVYGRSNPLGATGRNRIADNRIYFNRSYDEGGGIMIAGQLPADATTLSPGSGPVDITGNLIQANLGNDDGGGLRFLMAGNFPMNVVNNTIVNNVSTHEGGGISLDDAPNVRIVNNTIMKNLTTATAATSNGQPAPAGLSVGANSDALRASLPGQPAFSPPVVFNDVFWDNRAGTLSDGQVKGLGLDPGPIDQWDLGDAVDNTHLVAPTNSIVQQSAAQHVYTASPTNRTTDPAVVSPYDLAVDFAAWRTNPNFIGADLVAVEVPANLLGDYHLSGTASPAYNLGAASKGAITAPATDIDGDGRPASGGFDTGSDEIPAKANLSITKTDGLTTINPGALDTYTVVVTNGGPVAVTGATMKDTIPARLSGATCTAGAGATTCTIAAGVATGTTGALASGATATFTVRGTVTAPSSPTDNVLSNTATVTAPAGTTDPDPTNNSATDTTSIGAVPTTGISVAVTHNPASPALGTTYTSTSSPLFRVTITNTNPTVTATGVRVTDALPVGLSGVTWSCATTGTGSSCGSGGSTSSDINRLVNVGRAGGTVTFRIAGTVASTGTISDTAVIAPPSGFSDPVTSDNTATNSFTVALPALTAPSPALLDAFNRSNSSTLGNSWSQLTVLGQGAIRVRSNQASAQLQGTASWNTSFSARQAAAFDITNAGQQAGLILKASGGSASAPANYLLVNYTGSAVTVSTTASSGVNFIGRAAFPATLAAGDRLMAVARYSATTGTSTSGMRVEVYRNTSLIGVVRIATTGTGSWSPGTGGGRVGLRLPGGTAIDNFRGGTVS